MSTEIKQKGKNEKPPKPLEINRDIEISGFGFMDELPNPNDFWLDGVHGNLTSPLGGYDAIEIMDRTCPPIPETFQIIGAITGLKTILLGDEKTDQYKLVSDSLDNLEDMNRILIRTLEAIKAGMIVNEIKYNTTISNKYWLLNDIWDYHQSRFRFQTDNSLEIWNDAGWIAVDETKSFKVGSYATKYGNRYGYGLANYYYWPFQFYVGGGKRWVIFQDGLGTPKVIISAGKEDGNLDDDTMDKAEEFLKNPKAGESLVVPGFLKAMILESAKEASGDHLNFINYWAKQIAMLMIGTASHLQDRSTGTFAEEKVHQQIRRDLLLNYVEWLEGYINNQIIRTLVNVNFGQQEKKNYPKWKIIVPQVADELTLKKVELALKSNLPLSEKHVYEVLGMPQPEEGEKILTAPAREISFSQAYKDLYMLNF